MADNPREYIGDSVYVEYDGYHRIVLTTNNGEGPTNTIYLELPMIDKIKDFAVRQADRTPHPPDQTH